MRLFKFFFSFFLILASAAGALQGQAQPDFRFPVLALAITHDSTAYACIDKSHVYLVNLKDNHLISMWQHGIENIDLYEWKERIEIFGFQPYQNQILVTKVNTAPFVFETNVYPQDSIFFWDAASGKKTNRFPGNITVAFGSQRHALTIAENQFFEYQGQNNETLYGFKGGNLASFPSKIHEVYRGTIKNLQTDAQFNRLAVSKIEWDSAYSYPLEILGADSLKIISRDLSFDNTPSEMVFSGSGRKLALQTRSATGAAKETIIIDTDSGKIVGKVAMPARGGDDQTFTDRSDLQFLTDENQISFLEDNTIYVYNWKEQRILKEIWPNLMGAFRICGFRVLTDSTLLCYGEPATNTGQPGGNGFVQSINLRELRMFSDVPTVSAKQIFDPRAARLVFNDHAADHAEPQWSQSRSHFALVAGNVLSVWDARERKKILSQAFARNIRAFPDIAGEKILVIELTERRSFSDFTIHLIDLSTGEMKSIPFDGQHGISSSGSFQPSERTDGDWIHTSEGTIMRFDGDRFSQIYDNDHYTFDAAYESGEGVITAYGHSASGYFIMNINGQHGEEIIHSSPSPIVLERGAQGATYFIDNHTRQFFRIPPGLTSPLLLSVLKHPVDRLSVSSGDRFILMDDDSAGTEIWSPDEKTIQKIPVAPYSEAYAGLAAETVFFRDSGILSREPGQRKEITWSFASPKHFEFNGTSFDVSGDNRHLLHDKSLYHLSTGRRHAQEFPSLSNAVLLGRGADLVIFREGGDLFDGKRHIELTDPRTLFIRRSADYDGDLAVDKVFIKSPDENYVLGYPRFSLIREPEKYPVILWDARALSYSVIYTGRDLTSAYFTPDGKTIVITETKTGGSLPETVYTYYSIVRKNFIGKPQHLAETKQSDGYYSFDMETAWTYDPARKLVFSGTSAGGLQVWKEDLKGSPWKTFNAGEGAVREMLIRQNRLYTVTATGEIRMWDIDRNDGAYVSLRFSVIGGKQREFTFSTHDGYYWAEKSMLPHLHFVKDNRAYPVRAYDLYFNRPDIVLQRLAVADNKTIGLYRAAWEKRVERMGLKATELVPDFQRPVVSLSISGIPGMLTRDSLLEITVTARDAQHALRSIQVKNNSVPYFGSKGIEINTGTFKRSLVLPLIPGENAIGVVATNEVGVQGLEEEITVTYEPADPPAMPKIYYAGIGVSNYADSAWNLRYAAKDVRDIARHLRSYYGNQLMVDTLVNAAATLENITGLKARLKKLAPADKVIISFSGHGLLDPDYNFHYATYDMDFAQPEDRGLSYSMMEWLVDSIPPLRKLMLIDACHSGEIDAANVTAAAPASSDSVTSYQRKGANVTSKVGLQNSFALMREIFGDMSDGSGTTIISAAAGNEFAFESREWTNGVFTYSFLRGFSEFAYKTFSSDPDLTVINLSTFIANEVNRLTRGQQTPTMRSENIEWNWKLLEN